MINTYVLMGGIERYIVSGAIAGLRNVQWEEANSPAFTDGETIHLPRPDATMTPEELLLWRYKAEHELGHEDAVNCSPHWKVQMKEKRAIPKYKDDDLLWWIANLISDHVQEHNRIGQMIGRDEVLLKGREAFLKDTWRDVLRGKLDDAGMRNTAMFYWDTEARSTWNEFITFPISGIAKEVLDIVDKIKAVGISLPDLKNEGDCFEAAIKIRNLFPKEESEGGEKGEGGEPKEGGHIAKEGKKKSDKSTDIMVSKHEYDRPAKIEAKRAGYTPRVPKTLAQASVDLTLGYTIPPVSGEINNLLHRTNLPAKVRAHLMGMRRVKETAGYRSGRLDTNRLTDVMRGRNDVFKRKEDTYMVNSAISLLVDSSGSMAGGLYAQACAAAIMLAESLQGVGCNVEIAGFTELSTTSLIHELHLPFGKRFVRSSVLKSMENANKYLCQNADGESILYAYTRLKRQKESRKIMIVMSDGEPSAYGPKEAGVGCGEFTKWAIEEVEKDKSVACIGFGMGGYRPSSLYKNSVAVERGAALEPILLDLVRNGVMK